MRLTRPLLVPLLLSLLALMIQGCAGLVGVVESPERSFEAPAGEATVIFIRHTRYGRSVRFSVVDERGDFVAALRGPMNVAVPMPAGDHTFYVMAENVEPVHMRLEVGRTYLVETRVRMGWGKARVSVEPIRRGDADRWSEAPEWIRETSSYRADLVAGRTWSDAHATSISSKIEAADQTFASASAAFRAEHRAEEGDGYTPDELWGLGF